MLEMAGKYVNYHVLLVEDSPGDVRLMQESFRAASGSIQLHVATDGVEAMEYLRREGAYADAPSPHLIMLDLNLPRMDGREVLAEIKRDARLRAIPTVVLTTSAVDADVQECYRLQASCFLTKPVKLDAFEALVTRISEFWLTSTVLPQVQVR